MDPREIIKEIDPEIRKLNYKSIKLSTDALSKFLQRNFKKSVELLGRFTVQYKQFHTTSFHERTRSPANSTNSNLPITLSPQRNTRPGTRGSSIEHVQLFPSIRNYQSCPALNVYRNQTLRSKVFSLTLAAE